VRGIWGWLIKACIPSPLLVLEKGKAVYSMSFFLSSFPPRRAVRKDEILKVVEEVCFVLVSLADSIT
jgi:hypothetical protein